MGVEVTTTVNIPASQASRVDVVRRLLAAAREIGHDIRPIRWRRGGWDAPYAVAVQAGYITPDPEPETGEVEPPKRKRGRPRKHPLPDEGE